VREIAPFFFFVYVFLNVSSFYTIPTIINFITLLQNKRIFPTQNNLGIMANRDLLKEAIADAKAVKEVAIANAKAALEEAFTPQLQSMLSEKITKMEEDEELSEADKVIKEKKQIEEKGKTTDEAMDYIKEEELEEELDLEEILAELELEEGESETMEEEKDPLEEGEPEMEEGYEDSMKEAEGDDNAELDLENMSEDELQGFIEDVIEDMIEDGELVPGPNADESEAEEDEDTDDGTEGDADVDIEVDDIDLEEGKNTKGAAEMAKKLGMTVSQFLKKVAEFEIKGAAPGMGMQEEKELKEAKLVIKHLQSELNEVNLLNSKLLYTNKIFKAKNLTENQKIKVLKAFDKAETVKEAKVIYESLNENLINKSLKSNIKESMGFASKPAGVASKHIITEEKVIEEDAMVSRFKKLAGLK